MSLLTDPVLAIFLSVALGHLVGMARIGPVAIGGICGTLFVALVLGQLGIRISADLKDIAFALFIFALGFTAGPQFFANIRSGWRFGLFSVIEVCVAMGLTMAAAVVFQLDVGTIAGLFAGSATESAVVGTASEAISHLQRPAAEIKELQSNIATAYSLTYLFGLVGIVVFTTQIAPMWMKINLRSEARKLAKELGASEDGEGNGSFPIFVERAFQVGGGAGKTAAEFERSLDWNVTIAAVRRGGELVDVPMHLKLREGDVVFVRGRREGMIKAAEGLGDEVPLPKGATLEVTSQDVVLSRPDALGTSLRKLGEIAPPELRRRIFITAIQRMGHKIPSLPKTVLNQGDILTLYGPKADVAKAVGELGRKMPPADKTDFVMLGLGIIVGLLIGHISIRWGQMDLTLGKGGGALVSGLIFGWINMRMPAVGALPSPAANVIKDLGLAVFIAAIGLQAGPDALAQLKEHGLLLPILGVVISVVPAIVSLLVGWKLMAMPAPILLGAIAGQHCSTPTITALVSQSGNSIPVIGYTVTYAISNVILPLMGPVIVGLAAAAGSS